MVSKAGGKGFPPEKNGKLSWFEEFSNVGTNKRYANVRKVHQNLQSINSRRNVAGKFRVNKARGFCISVLRAT